MRIVTLLGRRPPRSSLHASMPALVAVTVSAVAAACAHSAAGPVADDPPAAPARPAAASTAPASTSPPRATASVEPTPAVSAGPTWAPGSREAKLVALCSARPMEGGKLGCGCCPPFEASQCARGVEGAPFEVDGWLSGSFSKPGAHDVLMHLRGCDAPVAWLSGANALLEDGPRFSLRWHDSGGNDKHRVALSAPGELGAVASAGTVMVPKSWLTGWRVVVATYRGAPSRAPAFASLLEMPTSAFAECTSDSPHKKVVFIGWVRTMAADGKGLKVGVSFASGPSNPVLAAVCGRMQDDGIADTDTLATWETLGKALGQVHEVELEWSWDGKRAAPTRETVSKLTGIVAARRGAFSF